MHEELRERFAFVTDSESTKCQMNFFFLNVDNLKGFHKALLLGQLGKYMHTYHF